MDLLQLYLTKYAKKATDGGERRLDVISDSVGMEPDSDTTDSAPAAGGPSTGTRGYTAPATGSSTTTPATRSPAAGTPTAPATGSSTTTAPATASPAAGTTPIAIDGAIPLRNIPPMFLNALINEALNGGYNGGYKNPTVFRNEKMEEINKASSQILDEVFKPVDDFGVLTDAFNEILRGARAQQAELMDCGARSVLDSYARYRASQAARGIYPRNPIAAEELQQRIREERLARRLQNHAAVAKEREAHIRALARAANEYEGEGFVPPFDAVFDYAKLIVPNTFGITGYPNKARANVILKDLARFAALKENPASEEIVNGIAAALDRLKSGPVSQVGKARDEYIVERGLKYLLEKSMLRPTVLRNVFGAGNSEYKDVVANIVFDPKVREALGLSTRPVSD
jgi:hypothetical protein